MTISQGESGPDGPGRARLTMVLIGAAAGLALWFLVVRLPDITESRRLIMALVALVGGFFAVLLAVLGPLGPARALKLAAMVALPAAGLLSWASLRFDKVADFLKTGDVILAWLVLIALPVPFLAAAMRVGEGWRDYRALFHHAWCLLLRYLVAGAFTGLFWGLILLSDQLLQIVGIDVIARLLDMDVVPWLLSGAMFGLGLAVVHELRAYISPYLALRLLRLMLPLVLVVSAVFLLAVPLKGLSGLFGALSPAALLMAMAAAAVTLITAVLDASDEEAATSRLLRLSARLMALLVVFLGALAALAVGLRVAQYGWTPARLAAAVSAALVLGYGLAYAYAVLRGPGWMGRIRRANIAMALAMIVLAALWLSPILNAQRISVNSQIARFESGRVAGDDLDLWAIAHDWGRPGQVALARLSDPAYPRAEELAAPLARLAATDSRWQWQRSDREQENRAAAAELGAMISLYPPGARLPAGVAANLSWARQIVEACQRTSPAGNPGCLAWVADFSPNRAGDEVLLVYLNSDGRALWQALDGKGADIFTYSSRDGAARSIGGDIIDQILAGELTLTKAPDDFLLIGESLIRRKEN